MGSQGAGAGQRAGVPRAPGSWPAAEARPVGHPGAPWGGRGENGPEASLFAPYPPGPHPLAPYLLPITPAFCLTALLRAEGL